MKTAENEKNIFVDAEIRYPGVATNVADDNKVDAEMVDEATEELNDNPRNNDL